MSDITVLRADRWVDIDRGRRALAPGDPSEDITMTQDVRFVMKGGRIYKNVGNGENSG